MEQIKYIHFIVNDKTKEIYEDVRYLLKKSDITKKYTQDIIIYMALNTLKEKLIKDKKEDKKIKNE